MSTDIEKGPLRVIDASFNIFESGWKKFGNHRKYIAGNVDSLINGDIVQERVERGVMVGFFGHNSNKELEAVERPDNPASHKTIFLKFHPTSGDVEHRQSINRTKTGQAVLSLHDSEVGNFSWRGKGQQSFLGAQFSQEAERHLRFDYVYQPGMVRQSKKDIIIKESVSEFDDLFARFEENGLVIEEAVKMCADWQISGMLMSDMEREIHESALREGIIQEQVKSLISAREEREKIALQALANTPYKFSPEAMRVLTGKTKDGNTQPLSEGDFLALIEEAKAYAGIRMSDYPGHNNGFTFKKGLLENPEGAEFDPKSSALAVWAF
ncbi:MAG: hypothetical protein ABIK68_17010 [bacterium]